MVPHGPSSRPFSLQLLLLLAHACVGSISGAEPMTAVWPRNLPNRQDTVTRDSPWQAQGLLTPHHTSPTVNDMPSNACTVAVLCILHINTTDADVTLHIVFVCYGKVVCRYLRGDGAHTRRCNRRLELHRQQALAPWLEGMQTGLNEGPAAIKQGAAKFSYGTQVWISVVSHPSLQAKFRARWCDGRKSSAVRAHMPTWEDLHWYCCWSASRLLILLDNTRYMMIQRVRLSPGERYAATFSHTYLHWLLISLSSSIACRIWLSSTSPSLENLIESLAWWPMWPSARAGGAQQEFSKIHDWTLKGHAKESAPQGQRKTCVLLCPK